MSLAIPAQKTGGGSPYTTAGSGLPPRLASIDTYRGIVMFLMLAEVLELHSLEKAYPNSLWAQWLAFHTTHVEWVGCSLHDMIQPSFTFLVGVSLPFSLAARAAKGGTLASMASHALFRSVILIVLGVLLRSIGRSSTNFYFVDTLTQIGLGYFWLFWLGRWGVKTQLAALFVILVGYWGLFAARPLPPSTFDPSTVNVPADWPHLMDGFAAHWNMNMNPAHDFEVWLMNQFPQPETFVYARGGYTTLSFIPTLGTMILGLLAGGILKKPWSNRQKLALLMLGGAGLTVAGWGLGALGICPVVKRIWTPSWVLFSGGLCFIFLGLLHAVCDMAKQRAWAWPVLIIGANSIVAYVMSWVIEKPIKVFLQRHLGSAPFEVAGKAWEPVLLGAAVLFIMWLILFWLFRRRMFVRI
jgi:heparan-alpha-glucosaminide N-acetyltransferase